MVNVIRMDDGRRFRIEISEVSSAFAWVLFQVMADDRHNELDRGWGETVSIALTKAVKYLTTYVI